QAVEVLSHPWICLELEGMGGLVERQPHAEVVPGQVELALDATDVGLDVVELARGYRLASEESEVILTEHTLRHIAEQDTDLRAQHGLVDPADELRDRVPVSPRSGIEVLDRCEHALESCEIGMDPVDAIECERLASTLGQR